VSENCGNAVALLDARLKRERDSHAENEREVGHVHIRHRVDLAGSVISPSGRAFYLCELVDEDHERDVESAKDIKRDDSMMNRLCSERVWHCGGDCTHGFTFA
jgi:hypothetical protein